MKNISILILSLIVFLSLALMPSCKKQPDTSVIPAPGAAKSSLPTEIITLSGQQFVVELAFKNTSRNRGMMHRKELPPNTGMLFIFKRSHIRRFHMTNCLIDLDIVFIKDDDTIAQITTMSVPVPGEPVKYYASTTAFKYALELPAGTAQRLQLAPGDKVIFPPRIRQIVPDPYLPQRKKRITNI